MRDFILSCALFLASLVPFYQLPTTGAGKSGPSSAAPIPVDWLMDNVGNADGVTPAVTTAVPVTHGATTTWVYNDSTGLVYSNGTQPVLLPFPVIISSTTYTGNGGIGLFCTTNGVDGHCGDIEARFS